MDKSAADHSNASEEVKSWSTSTTTKTWTSTSSSSTAENEELANSSTQSDILNQSINTNKTLGSSGGKEIKISIDNKGDNQQKTQNSNNSSSSTSTMNSSTSTTITEIREVAIAEHNKYRRLHGSPDLKADSRMHDEAQRYADSLAKGNKDNFRVSNGGKYGENIATSTKRDKAEAVKDAVTRMYETVKFYDYQRPGFNVDNKPTGLFSSIVWKSSEKIGVGVAYNMVEENFSIVFYYDPVTNVTNEFKENVLPPRA